MAAYLVEAGVLLVIAPWTVAWQHNYFGSLFPPLGTLMVNEFVRGGVSGVGLITVVAGLRDLTSAIFARQVDRQDPPTETSRLQ